MNDKLYKYHRVDVELPINTTAGTLTPDFQLDKEYDTIEGVMAIKIEDGGIPSYNVGLRDADRSYVDLIDIEAWDNTSGVAPKDQFIELNIPAHTNKYFIAINHSATLTAVLKFQLVLKLSKPKNA